MNKRDLITALAERADIPKSSAEEVVDTVFDAMAAALARGEGVEIRGFGSFVMRDYDSYQGRNPKTGEPIVVPPKRVPFFKAGKEMRRLVDANRHLPLEADADGDDGGGEDELPEVEG